TYDTAGVYTVNLTVTNKGGSSTETKADYITVDAVILHLDFDPVLSEVDQGESATYAITLDTVPDGLSGYNLTVSLSDDTVGEIIAVDLPAWASLSSNGTLPASSVWIKATDLNKEIQQGAENVPMGTVTVTGLAPGAADLSLDVARIDNDDGFALNPETGTAAFSVDMPAPVADFNAYVTSGTCPLAVQFTDLSAGEDITAWAWDFNNDGTIDSTEQNPVHTYTNIGLFTVTLEVSNTGGADVLTRSRYITVRDVPPVPPESSEDFTFDNNGTTFTDIGDQQQVSFNSSVCNGTVDGDNILLRNGKMNVTISTYGLSTIGDVSTGNVSSVLLESSPVNAPLGREVGNVSVGFNATMNNYNPDLGITTSIFDQPSAEASKVFTLAAADEKLSITSTAYAVYFTKTNLTEENGLRNAFLEMTVSPKWVKTNGGIGAIRVFRQGDDGVTQILDTTYLGINADGMMVFKAFSPDGFSSFAVAATAASATPVSVGDDSDDSSELSAASAGNLKAGETKTLSISNSPVTQIGLEMQSAVSSLLVTVTDERNSPAGAPVPDCDVWRYLSFALYHANPSAISDAVITFEVPEEVVGEKTAVLMWLNGNEWKELTTTSVGTEGNNRLFSAEIPEFSWFAIGITDVGTSSGEIPTEVITPTMTPSTEPTGTPVDITPVTPTTTATSPEDTVPPTQTPLSIAGVLFGAAGAGVLFRKIR
ncbi:PKD domain-containing protein, partial [Methanogenium cariaci]